MLLSRDYASPDAAVRDIDRLRSTEVRFCACMSGTGQFYFTCTAWAGDSLTKSPMFATPDERDAAQALAAKLLVADVEARRLPES